MRVLILSVLIGFASSQSVQAEDRELIRDYKCMVRLDQALSRNAYAGLNEGFEPSLATMTSVEGGRVRLFKSVVGSPDHDLLDGIPQAFQIVGKLSNKRIIAYSTGDSPSNKGLAFFVTLKTMGTGYIEISKGEEGRERWVLIYNVVCS